LGPLHAGAAVGASIAVDGACLTVAGYDDTGAEFDVVPETLSRTTLGRLAAGGPVNLERALPLSGRLDGHFVQGHVDTTATVVRISKAGGQVQLTCRLDDPGQAIYVVAKGSIAVSGVSLTVVDVEAATFSVALIPTTLARTTLGARLVGDKVNVETDILAKILVDYLRRSQNKEPAKAGNLTFEQLREAGWF
jgi:riboflavin synthase